jgi:hypothetical protein
MWVTKLTTTDRAEQAGRWLRRDGPWAGAEPPAGEKVRGSTTGRATPIANPPVAHVLRRERAFTERFDERLSRVANRGGTCKVPRGSGRSRGYWVLIDNLLVAETGKRRLVHAG